MKKASHAAAVAIVLFGCGSHSPSSTSNAPETLQSAALAKWAELSVASDPMTGWPSASDCDGTLWAGEAVAAGGSKVRLGLAEQASGEIHRRPAASGECFPTGASATVSRDMLMGYIAGKWAARDRGALERLRDYGESHAWVMGQGVLQDTFFTPDGAATLSRAVRALGGEGRPYDAIPQVCLPVDTDSAQHLQTLGIWLNGQIDLSLNSECYSAALANARAQPRDALMAAVAGQYIGDVSDAIALLLDPSYPLPSYVRGAPDYGLVHWLFAAHILGVTQ